MLNHPTSEKCRSEGTTRLTQVLDQSSIKEVRDNMYDPAH